MKKLVTLLLCGLFAINGFAQVPDGSFVQDFDMMSIDSQAFNLYDEFAAGRPVYIDVSATWCGPCWSYHGTHAFEDLYNAHDTPGDNTVRVIWIEGDPRTNLDCIYDLPGCSYGNSQGDWAAVTPYPIYDDSDVAQGPLDIGYYPTIYLACPDRRIYELGQVNMATLVAGQSNCNFSSHAADVMAASFAAPDAAAIFCESQMVTPSFELVNFGSDTLTSATVTLSFNGTVLETMDWAGNLSVYRGEMIQFGSHEISETGDLVVTVSNPNGMTDMDSSNDALTLSYELAKGFDEQNVVLQILTDQYGGEFYWEMRQDDGTVLASGGNATIGPDGGGQFATPPSDPGAYGNNALITENVTIPAEACYYFHLVDGYGDGICCNYGNGYFRAYNESDAFFASPIVDASNFMEDYSRQDFTTSDMFTSSIENLIPSASFNVYPNPTATNLNLSFELTESLQVGVTVTNAMGQIVRQITPNSMNTGEQMLLIPVNDLPNGVYNLTLQTEEGSTSRKFTVLK